MLNINLCFRLLATLSDFSRMDPECGCPWEELGVSPGKGSFLRNRGRWESYYGACSSPVLPRFEMGISVYVTQECQHLDFIRKRPLKSTQSPKASVMDVFLETDGP